MLSEKALAIKVQYSSEEVFDDALVQLINRTLEEARWNDFKYPKVTHCKHYADIRVPCFYMEIILDDKETV